MIHCHVYDDCAPILAIEDGNVRLSLTVPDTGHVTGQDVNRAMKLADAVAGTSPNSASGWPMKTAPQMWRREWRGGRSWYLRPPLVLPLAVRQRKR